MSGGLSSVFITHHSSLITPWRMAMRLVILSRQPSLYSTRVLVEAAQQRGHHVRVLDTLQFDIRVSKRNPELFYQGEPVGAVDAVIPRIGASITFYGLAVG